jgi:MATE family multidrug resistance protein
VCIGGLLAGILYIGAPLIYTFYGVSEKMIDLGVPFLRMQALSLFFMFVASGLLGFIRGIKNTKVPMVIFVIGILVFLLCDWLFIFGNCGFPALELQGSALAQVVRYLVMALCAMGYVFFNPAYRKYGIELFSVFTDHSWMQRLFTLSVPVMVDKATMALAYIWLGKMMCTMGKQGAAAFSVIKNMERFSILPAVAFAQVVTLLVSNNYGQQDWAGVKSNIKKVLLLASVMVGVIVCGLILFPEPIIRLFDQKNKFTQLAAFAYPFLGVLVFCDLLQLILAGALRATGNVRVVMLVRLGVFIGFFLPVSYAFTHMPLVEHQGVQFVLIYSAFYIGNAIMSVIFIARFRGNRWKTKII